MTDKLKSAVEELEGYKKLEAKILRYRETVRRRRDKLCSIKICDFSRVTGGDADWRERLIDEIEQSERHWAAAIVELEQLQLRIEDKMDKLPYPECEVLKRKYIDGQNFVQIAYELHYGYQHVRRLAGNARKQYAETYF